MQTDLSKSGTCRLLPKIRFSHHILHLQREITLLAMQNLIIYLQ